MQISRPETHIVKFRTKCALTRPQSQVARVKKRKKVRLDQFALPCGFSSASGMASRPAVPRLSTPSP